jgi:hypothetical protein
MITQIKNKQTKSFTSTIKTRDKPYQNLVIGAFSQGKTFPKCSFRVGHVSRQLHHVTLAPPSRDRRRFPIFR